MKRINKLLSVAGCFLIAASILATIIDFCCFQRSFYEEEYKANNTAEVVGMSQEDLMTSTNVLLDYLKDERQDIVVSANVNRQSREVFNERETLHMVDVKALYLTAMKIRDLSLITGLLILVIQMFYRKSGRIRVLREGYIPGVSVLLIFASFVGIYAVADFSAFWTNFHKVLFTNDLWLLDPRTSIMINLFPETFFFHLVIKIVLIYFGFLIISYFAVYSDIRKDKHD